MNERCAVAESRAHEQHKIMNSTSASVLKRRHPLPPCAGASIILGAMKQRPKQVR